MEHRNQIDHAELAKQVQLSPNEISAIIGKPPKLIYMLGGSVIFMVMLIVVIISFVIPYKEVLPVKITIDKEQVAAMAKQHGNYAMVTGAVNIQNAGLIKKGQIVFISLDAYPPATFGQLEGTVDSVLPFSGEAQAVISIRLNNGMISNNGYTIPPQPLLTGAGNILIKQKTYFSQLFTY